MAEQTYEELRSDVIDKFKIVYKDAVAMDACKVPKDLRLRMIDDPVYIAETKAIKAHLFIDQLEELTNIIAGTYDNSEKGSDRSATVLRCLELKQKLLLEDLNVNKDESNALNVAYIAMTKEDFEALDSVEVNHGGNSRELSADFGVSEDTDSFEARLKAATSARYLFILSMLNQLNLYFDKFTKNFLYICMILELFTWNLSFILKTPTS